MSVNPASISDGAVINATTTYAAPVGIPRPKIILRIAVTTNRIIVLPLDILNKISVIR